MARSLHSCLSTRPRGVLWDIAQACLLPLIGGCAGAPSMLDARGPHAAAIADLWWAMFWGGLVILTLVMTLVLRAVFRPPDARDIPRTATLIVGGGLILPAVVLTALLIFGFTHGDEPEVGESEPIAVTVVGHQWWWEVRYADGTVTANEIHIPVGQPVQVTLQSNDVIHSLWIPQLAGKQDLTPGRTSTLALHVDTPGAFRGQCAEFCGAQHARMAIWVIAKPESEFTAWLAAQREGKREPLDAAAQRGRDRFLNEKCVECHTVRGTPADGRVGPDLTHVATRRFLGAGTLPNEPGATARWIREHQQLKPGNRMKWFDHLEPSAVDDIAAWLEQP